MNEITIYIRYNTQKSDYTVSQSMMLGDLVSQLIDRGILPSGHNFVIMKGNEAALDQSMTLAENQVYDGDVLDIATPGKAG